MFFIIAETFPLLLTLFIFVLGSGFFSTLLALVLTINHATPITIGAMTGVYYAGLVLGSFYIGGSITRVGHIRAYAAFSSVLAIISLLHSIFYSPLLWLLLRFIAGFASAGLFVVIESWLLCKSTPTNRGRVLALYMIVFYAGQSFGQFFLKLGDPRTMLLFAVASMLCSLSIIPLAMTRAESPQFDGPSTLNFKKLLHQTPSGLLGCLSSGMIMGSIYALMPSLFFNLFHDKAQVANFMFAIIMGGLLLQYPVGKLSDIFERRLVLIAIAMTTILISVMAIYFENQSSWFYFMLMAVFGGLTFTMYPISITHAFERLENRDTVAGTQSLLLSYSLGAMTGPFITPIFIHFWGEHGLFIYFISICSCIIPLLMLRKSQQADAPQEEPFMSMPQTTPVIMELDPRGD